MKPISLSVSESDYEAFRRAAKSTQQPIAHLIREAMAFYRAERLESRLPLEDLPVLAGHRPLAELPGRHELHEEMIEGRMPRS